MNKPKIYKLGDAYWWAGYDLTSCIEDCENYFDERIDPDECYTLDESEMESLKINCEESGVSGTFAEVFEDIIAENQEFPCMFACTEY